MGTRVLAAARASRLPHVLGASVRCVNPAPPAKRPGRVYGLHSVSREPSRQKWGMGSVRWRTETTMNSNNVKNGVFEGIKRHRACAAFASFKTSSARHVSNQASRHLLASAASQSSASTSSDSSTPQAPPASSNFTKTADQEKIQSYLVLCRSEADVALLASSLASSVQPQAGDVICLHGAVGAGKTAFSRHLIRALMGDPGLVVPSPTFLLMNEYVAEFKRMEEGSSDETTDDEVIVHHYDLHRLPPSSPTLVTSLDWAYSFTDAISLIEWSDRIPHLLPQDLLRIHIGIVAPLPELTRSHAATQNPKPSAEEGSSASALVQGEGLQRPQRGPRSIVLEEVQVVLTEDRVLTEQGPETWAAFCREPACKGESWTLLVLSEPGQVSESDADLWRGEMPQGQQNGLLTDDMAGIPDDVASISNDMAGIAGMSRFQTTEGQGREQPGRSETSEAAAWGNEGQGDTKDQELWSAADEQEDLSWRLLRLDASGTWIERLNTWLRH